MNTEVAMVAVFTQSLMLPLTLLVVTAVCANVKANKEREVKINE